LPQTRDDSEDEDEEGEEEGVGEGSVGRRAKVQLLTLGIHYCMLSRVVLYVVVLYMPPYCMLSRVVLYVVVLYMPPDCMLSRVYCM